MEHIIPRVPGGQTELRNLALACQGCNGHKHARIRGYDPVIKKEVPLYHSRTQEWHEHFRWNNDFTLIIGLTPTGRVTLETLKLNRQGLINLRQVLYATGKHPPFLT